MSSTASELSHQRLDSFSELQAILAGLPMHAVPAPQFARTCGPGLVGACGGDRKPLAHADSTSCMDRTRVALAKACEDFPSQMEVLQRLMVEHASLDLVCFADHTEGRLFTAARGTDRMLNPLTLPRDLNNDMRIILGMDPCRTTKAIGEYRTIRSRFPTYYSFGCGHSLGGNVIEHLALLVEDDDELRFRRIDLYNTGSSPLRRAPTALTRTELHAHRVPGDWASLYYAAPPGQGYLHSYPPKPHVRSQHALGHFLPDKAAERSSDDSSASEPKRPEAMPLPNNQTFMGLFPFWAVGAFSCIGFRKCGGTRDRRDHAPPCIPADRRRSSEGSDGGTASIAAAPVTVAAPVTAAVPLIATGDRKSVV